MQASNPKIIISSDNNNTNIISFIDDHAEYVNVIKKDIIGNIYVGRIENMVDNINSAFVRIDKDTYGFLP